eukprot:COSAG03_NODE_13754_length_489_cov_1.407692_1_plen_29_part_10
MSSAQFSYCSISTDSLELNYAQLSLGLFC